MAQGPDSNDVPLESYRDYLLVLARTRWGRWFKPKVDPSDLVQEALLKAHRKWGQFRGHTAAERRAWLRQILARTMADAWRKLDREKAIGDALSQSSSQLENFAACVDLSPSQKVQREEQLLRLAGALAQLSQDERTALELRFLQSPPWSLGDIARHLNRPTAKAVAGLLSRGLSKLRSRLANEA